MSPKRWGALTPEKVASYITFDRNQPNWKYRKSDNSMFARQAEGVAGLWNKLALHKAALLADEVGTGKTLQALSVMAMLWQLKPNAKVLVMAPNRDICRHWVNQFGIFSKTHYRHSDGIVWKHGAAEPAHKPELCWSLGALVEAVEQGAHKLFVTTIYSLSSLVRGEFDEKTDRPGAAADVAAGIHQRLKRALGDAGFDLVVVDEAHYFRNSEGSSQRAKAARTFFGNPDDRLGNRALLMTATPCHSSMDDVPAILGYVTDVGEATPEALLKKYALRRLRRMQGKTRSHDKYSYRNECEVKVDFSGDPAGEIFFALYQKLLVRKQAKEGRRFLYGYLEGFESFDVKSDNTGEATSDDGRSQDFTRAPDTEILKRLSLMHARLGGLPAHPKYDALVDRCVPKDVFDASHDLHEHKNLVFVRRVPSVRELAKRINAAYDMQLARRIVKALSPSDPEEMLNRWVKNHLSREFFARYLDPLEHDHASDESEELGDDESPADKSAETEDLVHSQVATLFVVRKSGVLRTDCSNFSLRLRRSQSIFSLLLEPARDYLNGTYNLYDRRVQGAKQRDDYGTAARRVRPAATQSDRDLPGELFSKPMPTLWGEMHALLDPADRERLKTLAKSPARAESFASYIKNGFLFASPVIVELYCWYVEFQRRKPSGDAQSRYLDFFVFVRRHLAKSMALAYFRAALETFDALCENVADVDQAIDWHALTGLSSPAFYASSEVSDRQRLIIGFNSPFYPNVLASTSVLQEGVNLHLQCRKVHHYGIAWTPGDNEQRVGRVDRLFGKVNAHLRRDDKAELIIHYPYLANSIDEEQLASFIKHKHDVEAQMDACRLFKVGPEIDLQAASVNWRDYLRKLGSGDDATMPDPYPYLWDEHPSKDY